MKNANQHDKFHDSTTQQTISSGTSSSASDDITSFGPSSSVATNLTSPSKSSKFKTSNYSIKSIPEQPEVKNKFYRRKSIEVTKSPTRSTFAKLSPTKQIFAVNALLRPKFTRSKSSITSIEEVKPTTIDDFADTDSSEEGEFNDSGADISSIILGYFKPTDSMHYSTADFVFKESFDDSDPKPIDSDDDVFTTPPNSQSPIQSNSELQDANPRRATKKPFIDVALANSMGDMGKPNVKRTSQSSTSTDSDNIIKRGSGSSSATSMKFRFHHDKLEPISRSNSTKDRRKVLSASSNIDVNRYSLYNITTLSDNEFDQKYPDPTVTPLETPIRGTGGNSTWNSSSGSNSNTNNTNSSSNRDNSKSKSQNQQNRVDVDEIIYHTRRQSNPVNKSNNTTDSSPNSTGITGIASIVGVAPSINNRDTFNTIRSSMSSGELLNKLENFYDISENSTTSKHINEKSINKPPLPPIVSGLKLDSNDANLTAGLDSSSELPIMLYKVQDKDYDESNQRWSVYEHSRVSGQSYYKQQQEQQSQSQHSSDSSSSEEKNPAPKPRQPSNPTSNKDDILNKPPPIATLLPQDNSSKPSSPLISTPSSSIPSRAIPPLPSNNPSSSPHSVPQPAMLRDSLSRQNSHELMFKNEHDEDNNPFDFSDIEKQTIDYPGDVNYYSWSHFTIMMLLGLVICPLYFLLAIGLFDHSTNKQYYSGLYYSGAKSNKNWNRRFSKLQKLISLVIGIVWFSIVISMIGVGLGLGTR